MTAPTAHGTWRPDTLPGDDPYLESLLAWLHRLLLWHVAVTKQTYGDLADDEYRGLYVPEAEIELLTNGVPELGAELARYRAALQDERQAIEHSGEAAALRGREPALIRLGRLFGLSRFERDVLVLALAPELDLRYERLYSYIQDDVTRKRPTVDLALRLLIPDSDVRLGGRVAFAAEAPLLRHHLIDVFDEGQRQTVLLARFVKIDDAIVAELLDQPGNDPRLESLTTVSHPVGSLDHLVLPPDMIHLLRQAWTSSSHGLALALQGGYGQGRSSIAQALAAEAGVPLLTVNVDRLMASELPPGDAVERIVRLGRLRSAALFWRGIDRVLQGTETDPWLPAILEAIDGYDGVSVLPITQRWDARNTLTQTNLIRVALPMPTFSERERIWRMQLGEDLPDDQTVGALASTFRLSPGQIRDAAAMAKALTALEDGPLQPKHLFAACQSQSSGRLDTLARKISPTYDWDDIVLPADHMAQLREICSQMRHRRTVLESWGSISTLRWGRASARFSPVHPAPARRWQPTSSPTISAWSSTRSTSRRWSASTSARPKRTSTASSLRLRRRTRSSSSTKRTPSSASGRRSKTPTTVTPTSRSATCCRRSRSTTAS